MNPLNHFLVDLSKCLIFAPLEMCYLRHCGTTMTELYVNVNKVWLNYCDWLRNDFIATSTNYSPYLCLIAPCFASVKWVNIGFLHLPHCRVADARSPFMMLVRHLN